MSYIKDDVQQHIADQSIKIVKAVMSVVIMMNVHIFHV